MINESILTKSGLDLYHAELLKRIEELLKKSNDTVLEYASSLQFPAVGKTETIYIDKQNNAIYRWDDDNIKYYCVGNDYENINIINCGNATV